MGTYFKKHGVRLVLSLLFMVFLDSGIRAQSVPAISYLIPDIGTPGMNTYVEVIGPHNANGNFGKDGNNLNNPGDAVRVVCANSADTSKVIFGPCVVSWNGRMISTQAFVLPNVNATSSDWQQGIRIPIRVEVNGVHSNVDTFYIVKPQSLGVNGILSSPGALGSGTQAGINWGLRSRRGAMIVDSVILSGNGTYTVSTQDCDAVTPGNQGYLPFVLISNGVIRATTGSVLSLSADSENAGPGGGGGGGVFSEDTLEAPNNIGGRGYTGGEGGTLLGGEGTGAADTNASFGWTSLNGVSGGFEKPGAFAFYYQGTYHPGAGAQGTGGGTGMPFGTSGQGGYTVVNALNNSIGGYGGGSGAVEGTFGGFWTGLGGAGAGNATQGTSQSSGSGGITGNSELVPVHGGSGGAGGNEYGGLAGFGGGGGGAVAIFGMLPVTNLSLQANGSDGGSSTVQIPGDFSGAGGAGSGGGIILMSKTSLSSCTLAGAGGVGGVPTLRNSAAALYQYGGDGGAGRIRVDGPSAATVNVSPNTASSYRGPSTDTSRSVERTFTLSGTGNGDSIRLYLRPLSGKWFLDTALGGYAGNTWNSTITLPGTDTIYFLVAAQRVPTPAAGAFSAEPNWVLSQAAANILTVAACALTRVDLDSTSQKAGHTVNISLSIGSAGFKSNADSMQIMLLYNNDLLSYDSVIRGCVDSVRVERIDSMHTLVTLYFPRGYVLPDSTCVVADIRTSVMVTRAVSTDVEVESIALGAGGKSSPASTCSVNASFAISNACGNSTLRRFMETGSPISGAFVYPNPSSTLVTLRYHLNEKVPISVTIYDALGRIVRKPRVEEFEEEGNHEIVISALGIARGVYQCRLLSGDYGTFVRITLLK